MSDEEKELSEEEEEEEAPAVEKKKEEPPPKAEISEAELALEKMKKKKEEEEAYWAEYVEQRKKQKLKEEEDLKKLKDRQMKRKERRKEEEKKLLALKKQQEAQRIKEMEEKKAREAEAKKKRLEEAERKRRAMQEALQRGKAAPEPVSPNFVVSKKTPRGPDDLLHPALDKLPASLYVRSELAKTKEQLEEEKFAALASRVVPLKIEGSSVTELRTYAQRLWQDIVRLESEKYDLEERRKRQEYDLKELSERQRQINRSRALKKGLDPEALSGKHPPMINVASKYERRLDRRCFVDKKSLFEGGYVTDLEARCATEWESRAASFAERGPPKLPLWDPSAPKNKEKPVIGEPSDDDDIADFMPPTPADIEEEEDAGEEAGEEEEGDEEENAEEEEEE